MKEANAAFRFLLEVCALLAVGYWGFTTADGVVAFVLGLGVPLLLIAVWGTFGSPGAPLRAAAPMRLGLLAVIYGWAVAALATTGHVALAVALGASAVVNTALLYLLRQE